jgi:hypothetical protein
MSVALCLFDQLCAVGNAMAQLRDQQEPCSDLWTALTCLLLCLDEGIDLLVQSRGLACDNADTEEGEAC